MSSSNRSEPNSPNAPLNHSPQRDTPGTPASLYPSWEEPHRRGGSGVKGFFLGVLFTLLLGATAGIAYWFAQQRFESRQTASPVNHSPVSSSTATPLITASPESNFGVNSGVGNVDSGSGDQPSSDLKSSSFVPLNLQANHANGSTLRVTGIAIGDGVITLKMVVTNGYHKPIELQENQSSPVVLKDELGNVYNLVAPPDNPNITIEPNTTVRGDFVFSGQLAPSATTLTLITNSKYGSDTDYSTSPKFVITNIPTK